MAREKEQVIHRATFIAVCKRESYRARQKKHSRNNYVRCCMYKSLLSTNVVRKRFLHNFTDFSEGLFLWRSKI